MIRKTIYGIFSLAILCSCAREDDFDATGTFTSNAWIDRYRPDRKGGAVFRGAMTTQLPELEIDYNLKAAVPLVPVMWSAMQTKLPEILIEEGGY